MSWDWEFAWSIVPDLLQALVVTIEATIGAFAIALVLGLVLAILRRSKRKIVRWPVIGLIDFIRSTPILVQLYVLFFVLPEYGIVMSPLLTGIIGLGLHYSTYLSEVYRAGIEGVPRGQWEAAGALNMSRPRIWLAVVLPQAIPRSIPALGNYLNGMFKDTAQLSAITVVELLNEAQRLGQETFRYLEPMTMVGVMFLVVSVTSTIIIARTEAHFGRN